MMPWFSGYGYTCAGALSADAWAETKYSGFAPRQPGEAGPDCTGGARDVSLTNSNEA